MIEVTEQLVREAYLPRPENARKYDYGHLMVVGGSKQFTGSPCLAASAAMRAGCDLVTVVAVARAADAVANRNPNVVTWPLQGDIFSPVHLPEVRKFIENKTACVIGNGLGKEGPTLEAVKTFLKECPVPCVIDADAIRAIGYANHDVIRGKPRKTISNTPMRPDIYASEDELNQKSSAIPVDYDKGVRGRLEIALRGKPYVITPHAFEFSLLTGTNPAKYPLEERMGIVKNAAKTLRCVVALKGHEDVISNGSEVAVNRTGSVFMTKGGTGDTLAGIIGALLARGIDPFAASQAGCWLNGKAGERAGHFKGEGMLATDLIDELPHVLVETLEFVRD